jgi:ferritin-like metal-binding protein YciE
MPRLKRVPAGAYVAPVIRSRTENNNDHIMKLKTLEDLYLEELRDIYDAESQLVKALPTFAKSASSDELRNAFEDHLEQTKEQVERLEQVFKNAEASSKGKKCKGMAGLIEESKELLEEDAEPDVLDAGLIAAAQRIEHYEIAVYGCLVTYARLLEKEDDADLLEQSLDEEKETDELLTEIAESTINIEAAEEEEDEDEEQPQKKRSAQ